MGQVTTSLVVSFTDPNQSKNYHLSAEIDGRPTGLNKGITSFVIGDSPVYLVYKSSAVTISQRTTAGGISGAGGGIVIPIVETVTFVKSNTANLSKPPSGSVSWRHIGGETATLTVSETNVKASKPILAVYQATYNAVATAYRLSGVSAIVGVPNVTVIVFIEGTTP
jgi:hypothetical protein